MRALTAYKLDERKEVFPAAIPLSSPPGAPPLPMPPIAIGERTFSYPQWSMPKAFGDCNRSFSARAKNGAYHSTRNRSAVADANGIILVRRQANISSAAGAYRIAVRRYIELPQRGNISTREAPRAPRYSSRLVAVRVSPPRVTVHEPSALIVYDAPSSSKLIDPSSDAAAPAV